MREVVLDASALLALLRNEPGADKVADAIADARMSSVTLPKSSATSSTLVCQRVKSMRC